MASRGSDNMGREELDDRLNYTGPSMNPTLWAGDGLRVTSYGNARIHIGDVVVFVPPGCEHNVVHRVVSVDSDGVRTRGDNNSDVDPWALRPDDIIGRVVSIQRRNRDITVHGARWGRICALALRMKRRISVLVCRTLRPAHHWFARWGIFRKLLSHHVKTQVLCFRRPNGMDMQLLMGRWVIGRLRPGRERWHIRRPFRLFVDEASLPKGRSRGGG